MRIVQPELVLPVLIAVVGWVVTHRSSVKAQDRQQRNAVLDEARRQVTAAIRSYEQWLAKCYGSTDAARTISELNIDAARGLWADAFSRWQQLLSESGTTEWLSRLEEYEILFPETAMVRRELAKRHSQIVRLLHDLKSNVASDSYGASQLDSIPRFAESSATLQELVADQTALFEDLRIHVQNATLSEIFRRKVPARTPGNPNLPQITQERGGRLTISEGQTRANGS